MSGHTAQIRAFNRFYTNRIGVLEEHVVRSRFGLTEGRVLYEIASRGNTSAGELAKGLRLDPGYLHRVLLRFHDAELIASTPAPGDRRRNLLALTPEGEAAFAEIDRGSSEAIEAMIKGLDQAQRQRLVGAMRTIRTLLGDVLPRTPVVLRPHRIGELGWLVHRQGLLYNREHGWNGDFEALIAGLYRDFELAPHHPAKALWIAEREGEPLGSVFCVPSEGLRGSAQLRMLYVEPLARGQGIGRMLVDQCIAFAREAGYERVRLWTQSVLTSARRIYQAAGFELVNEKPHRSFGHDLVGETWELRFPPR